MGKKNKTPMIIIILLVFIILCLLASSCTKKISICGCPRPIDYSKEFQINRIISFEVRLEERDIKIIEDGDVVTFLRLEQKRSESNPFFWMDRFFVKKSERKSYESRQVFIDEEKI